MSYGYGLRLSLVVWSLSALLFSGCAEFGQWMHNGFKVGPDYCKPAAPVADQWIDFNNPKVISTSQAVDDGAWWAALNDPVLNRLVQQAYEQNLSLRAAGMRVMEARAQRAIAAGLLLPQMQEAFANYNHFQISAAGNQFGVAALPRTVDLWGTGFNVGWEVDLWGRFRRNLESADATFDFEVESYDDILVCLIAETAAAYVEIREFEARLRFALANVEAQQGSLQIAESRFRNGQVSELDVTIAQSNLSQTEALIPVLEKGLRLANNRLCVLLGIPVQDLRMQLGPAEIPRTSDSVVVGIPAELLRRRPDIRAAERQVAAQSALIGVAAADLFPEFTISGSINWQANDFSDVFTSAANGGFINPAFNWRILNYGRLRNNIRAQEAKFQELAILYQEAVLKANAEVEDAIVCFLTAQDRVRSLQQGVEAAQRSQEIVMTRYREGDADISAVFIAQSILVRQQDQLAAAVAEITVSLIKIYKALGGGWQIRCGVTAPIELPALEMPPSELPAPEALPTMPGPDASAPANGQLPATEPTPREGETPDRQAQQADGVRLAATTDPRAAARGASP